MKLGKTPARPEAYKLRLVDYLDTAVSPSLPTNFGHYPLVSSWGVLGNDAVGDCVIAGGLHEVMLWNAEQARTVPVSDACAIQNYSAITGYDPSQTDPQSGENPTDQGTDVQDAAKWRIANGLTDAAGVAHKIAAYVSVDPHNIDELRAATYLFGSVGLGLDFPDSAMQQFQRGQAWVPVAGAQSLGGHYVPVVGWRGTNAIGITWGERQLITGPFITERADEAIACLSLEMLNRHTKSPEGLDVGALRADLVALEAK